ncbi:MAG: hypothetical protein ACE5JG_04695 [Planctomycetota bacterium]
MTTALSGRRGRELLARASIRRARTEQDLERAAAVLKTSRARDIREAHPEERGAVRMLEVDGEVLAGLLFDPSPLELRGVPIRTARLVETDGENGRPCFRATGDPELFDLLMEELLGYLWARGYPLACAHGELVLFVRHGFVPCFYHPRVSLPTGAGLALPSPYRVRHLKSDDIRRIPELRACNREHKPLVFAAGVPPFHHFCVEAPDRSLRGFFSLEVSPDATWTPKVFVPELEVRDRDATHTILHRCAEEAARLDLEEIHLPLAPGHPVARACVELGGAVSVRGAAHDPRLDEEMLCAVDPGRLLRALVPGLEASLAASPAASLDGSASLGDGRRAWELRVAGGRVVVGDLPAAAPGSVRLPPWMVLQLLAGYRGADELDTAIADETGRLLGALFPKTPPWSMCDLDHWDPGAPRRPASRAAVRVMRAAHLPWAAPTG